MKKKDSSISNTAKEGNNARREYPYFCTLAADATPLNGMALRVIISDIRKHKTGDESLPVRAAKTKKSDKRK